MSVFLQPIYTQTVGSGGAASITFNSIPQSFNDLVIKHSSRTGASTGTIWDSPFINFNGLTTNQSDTFLYGNGTSVGSTRDTRMYGSVYGASTSSATSNTFGSSEIYIPNYTSSNFKSSIGDGVTENAATTSGIAFTANLWRSTAAITSITLIPSSASSFLQYSTFSLYGITKG
jgi:hypothetical protein